MFFATLVFGLLKIKFFISTEELRIDCVGLECAKFHFYLITFLPFSFEDPGPHGAGRYLDHMLPEIEKEDWRKGAQVNSCMPAYV